MRLELELAAGRPQVSLRVYSYKGTCRQHVDNLIACISHENAAVDVDRDPEGVVEHRDRGTSIDIPRVDYGPCKG